MTQRTSFSECWQRFWHTEGSTLGLGLFRIIFALCLFLEVSTTQMKSLFAIEGGFHLPYAYIPSFIHPVSEHTFALMHTAQYPLIALLGLGLCMRPAIAGLLVLQGYIFFSDSLNFRNHPYFFLILLLLLLFSPANESVSVKSFWRRYRNQQPLPDALSGPARPLTFQRMIMVQISLVYVLAGIQKINPAFLDGNVLGKTLSRSTHHWGGWQLLSRGGESLIRIEDLIMMPEVLMAASITAFLLEILLSFTLWFRPTRVAALIIGTIFHLLIFHFMNVQVFSFVMIGSYLLFLEPETLPNLIRKWFAPSAPAPQPPLSPPTAGA